MKKTGITRRIDSLGRIVIPKEIRNNLKIKDSDELEINIVNDKIILNKFENIKKDKAVSCLLKTTARLLKKSVYFTSKEKIIDYYILNSNIINNLDLNEKIMKIIENRDTVSFLDETEKKYYVVSPLIIHGDLLGSIVLCSDININDKDEVFIRFLKDFLENYLE